jgi:hypothetical protein
MMPLPGPGLLIVVFGLGILSLEFEFARVWLHRARAKLHEITSAVKAKVRARREG